MAFENVFVGSIRGNNDRWQQYQILHKDVDHMSNHVHKTQGKNIFYDEKHDIMPMKYIRFCVMIK